MCTSKLLLLTAILSCGLFAPAQKNAVSNLPGTFSKAGTLQSESESGSTENSEMVFLRPAVSKSDTGSRWELGISLGASHYFGDLNNRFLNGSAISWMFGLKARYWLNDHVSLSGQLSKLNLRGSDASDKTGNLSPRGLSFTTQVYDLNLLCQYNLPLFRVGYASDLVKMGVATGVSAYYFNPRGKYQGKWYNLRELGTEGQTINGSPYPKFSFGIPMAVTLRYPLSSNLNLEGFLSFEFCFTDYFDDVSDGPYPDPAQLRAANGSNGDAAVYLSDPTGLGKTRPVRGAPQKDDYSNFGISLMYAF